MIKTFFYQLWDHRNHNTFCILIHVYYKNKLLTFSIQIILSISKNNSTLYLIKIKLLQDLVLWIPQNINLQTISELHFLFHTTTWLHWPANHSRCGLCMRHGNCLLQVFPTVLFGKGMVIDIEMIKNNNLQQTKQWSLGMSSQLFSGHQNPEIVYVIISFITHRYINLADK